MTVAPREQLPTLRGGRRRPRSTRRRASVIARKGILAATVADIAAEAGKSTASFYNYYDSKEAMVREWAVRFRDEAQRAGQGGGRTGPRPTVNASYQAAAAHWHTYRHRLAEMISVSQLAMVNDDFAQYWSEICSLPIAFITDMVIRAQRDGFCTG